VSLAGETDEGTRAAVSGQIPPLEGSVARHRKAAPVWLAPLAVLAVAAGTAIVVRWGPPLRALPPTADLRTPGLAEPADRLLLVAWWGLAIVIAFLGLLRVTVPPPVARRGAALTAAAGVGALVVLVLAIQRGGDPTGLWSGLPPVGWVLGLIGLGLVIAIMCLPRRAAAGVSAVAAVGLVPLWALGLVQLPGAMHDPFHFAFTSDEIAAAAVGHVPLGDYVPQYSVLLSYPVALVRLLWHGTLTPVVLAYLLALEVVALALAVVVPVRLGGRRLLVPSLAVVVPPVLLSLRGTGMTASSYFAVLPMRVVLPALTLVVAWFVLTRRRSGAWPLRWGILGVLLGATALNNPDYGLPALGAVAVTAVLAARGWRVAWRPLVLCAAGTLLVPLGYAAFAALAGSPVRVWSWLYFSAVFGSHGFNSLPATSGGLHVAVVALFTVAAALGFVLVRVAPRGSWRSRQGVALCLVGGWALLTLPYYAGRSLPATVVGGYAYACGMVAACLLPLMRLQIRAVRARLGTPSDRPARAVPLALVGLAVVVLIGSSSLMVRPGLLLTWLRGADRHQFTPVAVQAEAVRSVAAAPGNEALAGALARSAVAQALPAGALFADATGIRSAAVTNSDAYFPVSRTLTTLQCEGDWAGADLLLVTPSTADALRLDPACDALLDPVGHVFTDGASTFVLLARPGATP
jgi:hypothetical protein